MRWTILYLITEQSDGANSRWQGSVYQILFSNRLTCIFQHHVLVSQWQGHPDIGLPWPGNVDGQDSGRQGRPMYQILPIILGLLMIRWYLFTVNIPHSAIHRHSQNQNQGPKYACFRKLFFRKTTLSMSNIILKLFYRKTSSSMSNIILPAIRQ